MAEIIDLGKKRQIIKEIMANYPEEEWFDRCQSALPDSSHGSIVSIIVILSGGDVINPPFKLPSHHDSNKH